MERALRDYLVLTAGYWAFTLTDGAIRMLVVLHFHRLGFTPLEVAGLFLFYEFFGVVTNLVGGWLGARIGLERTLFAGMALQIAALGALAVPSEWLTVPWVMAAQAVSGIAKDLSKMSAKAGVRAVVRDGGSRLFRWVSWLTGSKNALKGAGFFLGALLLQLVGFRGALLVLAGLLALALIAAFRLLPRGIGRIRSGPRFSRMFSRSPAINRLSAARLLLFGARDLWFVVALPVFLSERLGWDFWRIGAFFALWIVGYGLVQATTPQLLRRLGRPDGRTARNAALALSLVPAGMASVLPATPGGASLVAGLALFGLLFAINSAVHSYLVLAWSDHEGVSMDVGFYYMANAGGRLIGTLLSGLIYQWQGLEACLWGSALMLGTAALISIGLPARRAVR